jgi:hypothetical protein
MGVCLALLCAAAVVVVLPRIQHGVHPRSRDSTFSTTFSVLPFPSLADVLLVHACATMFHRDKEDSLQLKGLVPGGLTGLEMFRKVIK